jgi:putative ABC transport system permease protein
MLSACYVIPVNDSISEIFEAVRHDLGVGAARSWYWGQVLKSAPMFLVNHVYGSTFMVKNHLKLAYRNILRHKRYAVINILGLAVGLAACLLMAGYILHEMSFESGYPEKERIYRINGRIPMGGRTLLNGVVAAPFGPAAEASIPEVEESVRWDRSGWPR